MALDELHARRLATVATLVGEALDRIELVLGNVSAKETDAPSSVSPQQVRQIRRHIEIIRKKVRQAVDRFAVRLEKPDLRQVLAAELSALWVVLENAAPKRMRGYGREFSPKDKVDWENLIQGLVDEVDEIRKSLYATGSKDRDATRA